MIKVCRVVGTGLLVGSAACAQMEMPKTIPGDQAIDTALKLTSLSQGGVPFHAVLKIDGPSPVYTGKIDLLWMDAHRYRLTITSPSFQQLRIVHGDEIFEKNDGDYYPRWLENFTDALLDPLPVANFRGRRYAIAVGDNITNSCMTRNDRPGGITDDMTWGSLCFSGSVPLPEGFFTFNRDLSFSDYKSFGKQRVARTYTTDVLDYKTVTGKLVTLEALKQADAQQFEIARPTPASEVIATKFVSTLKEESLIDHPPIIEWPAVREGKTDGYMIVYARTDRTGQVRETAKHNSDNPGLEQFGMEQALRYKFHPLVVDGVAQQMEMPLVLHFSSHMSDPLPVLTDAEMRKQISGCKVPTVAAGENGRRVKLSVDAAGKLTGETFVDANDPSVPAPTHFVSFRECKFAPYLVKGVASYYHGILVLPR